MKKIIHSSTGVLATLLVLSILGCGCTKQQPTDAESSKAEESSAVESVVDSDEPSREEAESTENNSETESTTVAESSAKTTAKATNSQTTAKATAKATSTAKATKTVKAVTKTVAEATQKTQTKTTELVIRDSDYNTPSVSGIYDQSRAEKILKWMNEDREKLGLGKLTMDNGNMMVGAKLRAREITASFAHARPNGETYQTIVQQCAIQGENPKANFYFGENLAYGNVSAEDIYAAWKKSPAHWTNITKKEFTHVSIAVFKYNDCYYYAQLFRN